MSNLNASKQTYVGSRQYSVTVLLEAAFPGLFLFIRNSLINLKQSDGWFYCGLRMLFALKMDSSLRGHTACSGVQISFSRLVGPTQLNRD